MRILLDADTLIEFLLNRSEFIGKVEYLSEIFGANSSIQLYLSKPGLDKIVTFLKPLKGLKKSQQLVIGIRKRVKILRLTKAVAKRSISSSAIDYESAVEIQLAIEANIGAIATHKPGDFSAEELSIITMSDLQQRRNLEDTLSKNINDLPAILIINPDQISKLDKAFHLPSYICARSLKPKESSHQLDLTCSSDKVSSKSTDKLSPQLTNSRSLGKTIADGLSNRSVHTRSIAKVDILKYDEIVTVYRAYQNPLHDLIKAVLQSGEAYSSLVNRLSIKPINPFLKVDHFEAARSISLTQKVNTLESYLSQKN